VARDLRTAGHAVVGVDASPTLVAAARQADPDGDYRVGDAAALPSEDGAVDLVVAYNSLMDVDDLPGSVAEASRVLSPGGRLVMAVIHPVTNTSQDGPYVQRRQFVQGRSSGAACG
jgi:ubiquinone/menaquinone biosynthesis C-methylase UbiE